MTDRSRWLGRADLLAMEHGRILSAFGISGVPTTMAIAMQAPSIIVIRGCTGKTYDLRHLAGGIHGLDFELIEREASNG